MREVKLLKHLPWLVLFLLFTGGTSLWWLFVNEQQAHLRVSFQNQLERLSDELLRSRLQGQLGPDSLPEGIRTFAIYGDQGELAAGWGPEIPGSVVPFPETNLRGGQILSTDRDGWVEFLKVLQPLRNRMNLLNEEDPDDAPRGLGPGPAGMMGPGLGAGPGSGPPRLQGYLFLRVSSAPLEGRLWTWTLGGVAGTAAWAGFTAFIAVLWFRARRYQDALVQHRELLQFAEASRTLSHELQTPLAAILLQTALLKRTSTGAAPPEVEIIEEEARRMSALVTRVRDFLKDPAGQAERIDLADFTGSLAGRFSVEVAVETEGSPPFCVRFDSHRLRSVVENLIKNAVESGPVPQVRVRLLRPKTGTIRLEITDSGTGFTQESLRQALNPFYTTKTTGTGIGLSIADGFVRAAGGRLKLENRPEGGARVTLDLPEAPIEAGA